MIRKILFGAIAILISTSLFAQETEKADSLAKWKKGGLVNIAFSQVSLNNWAAGGQSSMSANGILSLFANYKHKRMTWDNTLDMAYGLLQQEKDDIIKSDDKIEFVSKYGQKAFKSWYYSALFSAKSQFTSGYNYPDTTKISDFLSPAYFVLALGMDYKPSDKFTLFISPFTGKSTLVNSQFLSDKGAFGVEKGKHLRNEFGGYLKAMYKSDIMENISLTTKIDLFSNYLDNPQNVDVNWEVLIGMKINKYISATINTVMIYDHDVDVPLGEGKGTGKRLQFKEVFGLGFSYKF